MDEKTFGRAFNYIRDAIEKSRNFEGETEIELGEGKFLTFLHENEFKKFEGEDNAKGAAVDGSSLKILDAHSFIISMRRVGYLVADEKNLISRKIYPAEMDCLSKHEPDGIFKEKYENLMGCSPPKIPDSVESINDAIRALEEHAAAREAMETLEEGDILMMDGSLQGSEYLSDIIGENCRIAMEKGIHIVGVCKRSELYTRKLPVLNWVKSRGDRIFGKEKWYYPLSRDKGIYIAKLHKLSRFSFRIDINPEEKDIDGIMRKLSAFSNDVSYIGYPYPLALIHREVVLTSEDGMYCRRVLREMALKSGYTIDDWEEMFFDYHEYLE